MSVAQGLVLHAPAHGIDAAVADAHHVERVSDAAGVIEVRGQPGTERLGEIGDHHLDARQPCRVGALGASARPSRRAPQRPPSTSWPGTPARDSANDADGPRGAPAARSTTTHAPPSVRGTAPEPARRTARTTPARSSSPP